MSEFQTIFGARLQVKPLKKNIERLTATVKHTHRILVAGMACLALSACSVSSVTGSVADDTKLADTSVKRNVEPQGVASGDAELIKTVVADAGVTQAPSVLAWTNPDTGSSGTITAINKFTGSHGQKCKKFQTTVDTFMGISLYNGETCELREDLWVLSWFLREDA